jgi:hypothetical protein
MQTGQSFLVINFGKQMKYCLPAFLIYAAILCFAQSSAASSLTKCRLAERSIFDECSIEKTRDGTLSKRDLTVEGFAIGQSTLNDVNRRFSNGKRFRLTRGEESPIGICVKNKRGQAAVFASGSSGGWKILDSVYLAPASTVEKQGAQCFLDPSLASELATESGIRLGMERDGALSLLRAVASHSFFQVNFITSPAKAPWVSKTITPTDGIGWVAMSGALGEFKEGRLRWISLYGGVSD